MLLFCLCLVNNDENYPPETWTHVYTDGSATKAITDGGAGIIIQYPSGATQTARSATGKHCTNYRAETEASILVKDCLEPCSPTVFLTDAVSVLEANEQADQLTKCGAEEEQPSTSIQYQEKTTIIKNQDKRRVHTTFLTGPARWFWLDCVPATTGSTHSCTGNLKSFLPPASPCGEEDQTNEHLQRCNRHQPERIAQWPSATPLHQKLYWGLDDLKKTTNLITAAGLVRIK